jgi:putative protease
MCSPLRILGSLTYSDEMSEQETEIGEVMTYYANIGVAAIELTGSVKVGDTIIFRGFTTDLEHKVDGMQIEHDSVQEAKAGDQIGVKVPGKVRKNDRVYKK